MPQISATFCISWKEKILDEPLKKNQQNTSHKIKCPKNHTQMHHGSKAKVAKLEKLILLILVIL
jgi:hypothetical protein